MSLHRLLTFFSREFNKNKNMDPSAPASSKPAPASFTPPPPPALNGGLYTGEPFAKGAPWANVPITPDAGVYNFTNLPQSAPRLAKYHVPSGRVRPGNSTPMLPPEFVNSRPNGLNAICIPGDIGQLNAPPCPGSAHGRGPFSYLL